MEVLTKVTKNANLSIPTFDTQIREKSNLAEFKNYRYQYR